ncbi:GNAT family N-acetyltransferase [Collinsella vaginalis]|uniref:GNAT family N-acetyltransferase n=1 Tax=Collinsella vaginalis TaxID=1870987 RepID=UPI000A26794F|nr:GNAT family N-acetyltransferase [Collinsella vaginalis]
MRASTEADRPVLEIRRARVDEIMDVLGVLEDGRRSIARLGIDQWQAGYPDQAVVEGDLARGSCCIAFDAAGHPVGTLVLVVGADPDYEPAPVPWLTEAGAVYASIHRVATAARVQGHGVMRRLFGYAAARAAALGCASIRVDTHPGNAPMRAFLRSRDFQELGRFELSTHGEGSRTRIAFERLLGDASR